MRTSDAGITFYNVTCTSRKHGYVNNQHWNLFWDNIAFSNAKAEYQAHRSHHCWNGEKQYWVGLYINGNQYWRQKMTV